MAVYDYVTMDYGELELSLTIPANPNNISPLYRTTDAWLFRKIRGTKCGSFRRDSRWIGGKKTLFNGALELETK